uniref:Uncharacterized protein n=1 Tax=Aegilops tauschii subsp. strangulata TaxID=200361 RepID=A0A452YC90_AEGTS
ARSTRYLILLSFYSRKDMIIRLVPVYVVSLSRVRGGEVRGLIFGRNRLRLCTAHVKKKHCAQPIGCLVHCFYLLYVWRVQSALLFVCEPI